MEQIIGWAIESCFEYDELAGALALRPGTPPYSFQHRKIQYNQAKNDPYGCTWYWWATFVVNCWWANQDWDKEDWDWFRTNATKYWWKDKEWMYTSRAWDMIVDRLNIKFPQQKRVKEAIQTYGWEDLVALMRKKWILHMGSLINSAYTNDIKDWVIEKPRGAWWTGHSRCIALTEVDGKEWVVIIENYFWWLTYNVIDIKDFQELLNRKQFHNQMFIYYPTENMTEIPYPYMTYAEAESIKKQYPMLVSPSFQETVRAWIDASQAGKFKQSDDKNIIRWKYRNYTWIDWVAKMIVDLEQLR